MKTIKMSLANMQGKLSRAEMKNIMAGSGDSGNNQNDCHFFRCANNGTSGYVCGDAYLDLFADICPKGGVVS